MQQASSQQIPAVAPKPTKSKFKKRVIFIILLFLAWFAFLGVVYYFGSEQPHSSVPHALDEIFGTQVHVDLIATLNKKAYEKTVLWGKNETGIFEFLQHYADERAAKGGLVIVKRIENNVLDTVLKFLRMTKDYIEQNIDLEPQLEKVQWIFLVYEGYLPVDEIDKIKSRRPKDRIVIGINEKPTLKGFKSIQFPAVEMSVVQKVISQQFEITGTQAQILSRYYKTVPQVIKHLNQISYTHQKHLGQNYQNLKHLSPTQMKVLKKLCKLGIANAAGNTNALEQVGAVTFDNHVYWENRVNRLNYQLSQHVLCQDQTVPDDIKVLIDERREQESKKEIEAEEDKGQGDKVIKEAQKTGKKNSKSKDDKKAKQQKAVKSDQKVTKSEKKQKKGSSSKNSKSQNEAKPKKAQKKQK